MLSLPDVPPFEPPRWLRGPHAQTIVGSFLSGRARLESTRLHHLALPDGDQLVLHDDRPVSWRPGEQTALLIHGLGGCHSSPYMRRIAARLVARNRRVFRLDLRGSGAGEKLARLPYHAGLTADILVAMDKITNECPGSPLVVAGFSLGGNMLLKLLGELGTDGRSRVQRALAVCPPIDLHACAARLEGPSGRFYDRYFVRLLCRRLAKRREPTDIAIPRLRRLREFDDFYTARISGFRDVGDYYDRTSAAAFIPAIDVPTWIIAARDDPVVDFRPFEKVAYPPRVALTITDRGGHLGYLARRGLDPDRFWLDWRLMSWLTSND
jgi:predicted alpha/beta-fold hydrolase